MKEKTVAELTQEVAKLKHYADSVHMANMNNQMQMKIDHLQAKLDGTTAIAESVSNFYDHAFTMIALLFGVVGILVPVLIQWYQQTILKKINADLANSFKEEYNSKIETLDTTISGHLETLNKLKETMSENQSAVIFYSQGQSARNRNDKVLTVYNYLYAAYHWMRADSPTESALAIDGLRSFIKDITNQDVIKVKEVITSNPSDDELEQIFLKLSKYDGFTINELKMVDDIQKKFFHKPA